MGALQLKPGIVAVAGVLFQTHGDSLAKLRNSGIGGILGVAVTNGLASGFHDIFGCGEIGLSQSEADDVIILQRLVEHLPDGRMLNGERVLR